MMMQSHYLPPAMQYAPSLENAMAKQELAPRQGPSSDLEQPNFAPVSMAPEPVSQHQATYTLDQVKELLALERERASKQ